MYKKNISDEDLDSLLFEYMPKANLLLNQLEEERDKDIPPHVFSNRYNRNIKKIIKKYSKTPIQRKLADFRKYVAVVLIIFVLINGFFIVTIHAYRERVIEIITTVYKAFTSIITETENVSELLDEEFEFSEPSYIPEGFEVVGELKSDVERIIDYENGDKIIVFDQSVITNSEIRIDTEDTEIKELVIGEYTVSYVYNKGMYNAYWNDDIFIYLITTETSYEELIKIIESVIQNKK